MKHRHSKLNSSATEPIQPRVFQKKKKIVCRRFSKFNLLDNSWRIFWLVICADDSSCHAGRFVHCEIPFFGGWMGHLREGATVKVLSLLPPYEGKSILELGAGIGRFTVELAKKAGSIVALDFMEGAIKKNESINGHHKHAKFICDD